MQIEMKLYKPFVASLNKLKDKYGETFTKLNGFHNSNLNYTEFIDNFVDSNTVADATIDANANNSTKDIKSLMSDMHKAHTKLLSFNKIYYEFVKRYGIEEADKWLEYEWSGSFYLHNAPTASFKPYCFAYDLDLLVEKGLFFIDKFKSTPAKHLGTFNDHVLEFVSWVSNSSSGAVGLPSYLVYSWWYWYNDINMQYPFAHNPEYYREQCFQKFIHDLNQPYLRVVECAFTNITIMDKPYLIALFGGLIFPDGTMAIDHIEDILEHQKVFMKVKSEVNKKLFMTFPVLTFSLLANSKIKLEAKKTIPHEIKIADDTLQELYDKYITETGELVKLKDNDALQNQYKKLLHENLSKNNLEYDEQKLLDIELAPIEFIDEDFAKWANKHNMEWCDANFFVGNDVTTLSNCCRLLSNTTKLKGFINSIGGTSLKIGSVQVNTINLRRIALESQGDTTVFIDILKEKLLSCANVLDIIRHIIKRNIEKGLLPIYDYKLIELQKQFNTIGVTSMYETIKEFGYIHEDEFNNQYYTNEGLKFASLIFNTINTFKDEYVKDKDYNINVENVPGERANVILAQKDTLLHSDNTYNTYMYANQWIGLNQKCTIDEKIKLGSILDKKCGGGQISHINIQSKFNNENQSWELLNDIANAGVIYFAYNIKISTCEDGHGFFGSHCYCGKVATNTFSRVVGFLTPRSSYSKERKQEFDSRQWFNLNE